MKLQVQDRVMTQVDYKIFVPIYNQTWWQVCNNLESQIDEDIES